MPKNNLFKQFSERCFEQGDRKWQQNELGLGYELDIRVCGMKKGASPPPTPPPPPLLLPHLDFPLSVVYPVVGGALFQIWRKLGPVVGRRGSGGGRPGQAAVGPSRVRLQEGRGGYSGACPGRTHPHQPRLADCSLIIDSSMAAQTGNGSIGGTRGRMGISYLHSHGGGNVDAMAQQRRLGSLWSFLRQQDVGESIAAGNGSSDLLRIFSMSTCDDTNSNVIFSAPGSKKAEVLGDSDVGMVTSFSNIDSQHKQEKMFSINIRHQDEYRKCCRKLTNPPKRCSAGQGGSHAWRGLCSRRSPAAAAGQYTFRKYVTSFPKVPHRLLSKPRWRLGNKELAQLWKWAELNPMDTSARETAAMRAGRSQEIDLLGGLILPVWAHRKATTERHPKIPIYSAHRTFYSRDYTIC
ncbi:hypothetical protein TRIUR3_18073 [Triticum urartu]|uniref:Uncharacterized protein n=1 Tax=Triticum urartu TaxID=4572 RepID=M7ZUJ3_TRIUA|nr:hypothetical protein TRIUR3_18073 [Triticum urartu]